MLIVLLGAAAAAAVAVVSGEAISPDPSSNRWSWISGGTFESTHLGVYENVVKGDYATSLSDTGLPAARDSHAGGYHGGIDLLYVFGGVFYQSTTDANLLNDLWVYNVSSNQWGWVYGACATDGNQQTVFTCPGAADGCAVGPGSRITQAFETEEGIVVYGQVGADTDGTDIYLTDVWSFSFMDNAWTWLAGNTEVDTYLYFPQRNYFLGVNFPSYSYPQSPGSREGACWVTDGDFGYLVGGQGVSYQTENNVNFFGFLNDVWSFDLANGTWTWMLGSSLSSSVRYDGDYSLQGVEDPAIYPRRRAWHACSVDSQNEFLYVFGGAAQYGDVLSDTMKLNLKNNLWTFISGSFMSADQGNLGASGHFSVQNYPENRYAPAFDQDSAGNLFIYGGYSVDSVNNNQNILDVWIFNASQGGWTRAFSGISDSTASYFQQDAHCRNANPGYRMLSQISVNDDGSALYLAGGFQSDSTWWDFSDLWNFEKVDEGSDCGDQVVAPTPTPAAPVKTRRPINSSLTTTSKLTGGAIAGIVTAVLLAVFCTIGLIWFVLSKVRTRYGDRAVPQETVRTGQGDGVTTTYEYPTQKLEFSALNEEDGFGEPSASHQNS